jgi:predicted  nucleic acid-binding Zn-ribbon protein
VSELSDNVRNEDSRLDRIEKKIDKLTDAMVEFARTEQKIISLESQQNIAHERMNKHSQELDKIRNQQIKNTHTLQIITFVVGVIFTAVIGVSVKMFL